jgi:hypothetical protein
LLRIERREDERSSTTAAEEVVAQSLAYSVCGVLGLDGPGSVVPYVDGRAGGAEGDPTCAHGELVDRLRESIDRVARRTEAFVCG